jgi:hypothetical protein
MPEKLSPEEQKMMAIILAVLFLVGAAIIIARTLFPYFLIGSVGLFIIAILVFIIELIFRDKSYLEYDDYISFYIGIAFAFCLVGLIVTYIIGYGLGGTSIGQASVAVYTGITGAEKAVSDATNQAINSLVEENCKILTPTDCTNLRNVAKTAKTLQEISDFTDKLKTAEQVVDAVTK